MVVIAFLLRLATCPTMAMAQGGETGTSSATGFLARSSARSSSSVTTNTYTADLSGLLGQNLFRDGEGSQGDETQQEPVMGVMDDLAPSVMQPRYGYLGLSSPAKAPPEFRSFLPSTGRRLR